MQDHALQRHEERGVTRPTAEHHTEGLRPHFLGRSEKDVVDVAVRDYVDAHRDEINEGIRAALGRLDGSNASVVSLISGMSRDELDDLGGVPEA